MTEETKAMLSGKFELNWANVILIGATFVSVVAGYVTLQADVRYLDAQFTRDIARIEVTLGEIRGELRAVSRATSTYERDTNSSIARLEERLTGQEHTLRRIEQLLRGDAQGAGGTR